MKNTSSPLCAFTLIEILVVMSIIALIALGGTQINFKRLSEKQELDILSNTIIQNIESVRDFSYNGKGMGIPLETPSYWQITFDTSSKGSIDTIYHISSGDISYPSSDWKYNGRETLASLKCEKLDGTSSTVSTPVQLVFTGENIQLIGCPDPYYKKIILEFQR